MSEPTLYRIDYGVMADLEEPQIPLAALYLSALENLGVLVPVERCEHGRLVGHWVQKVTGFSSQGDLMYRKTGEWCSGAGIGDNE